MWFRCEGYLKVIKVNSDFTLANNTFSIDIRVYDEFFLAFVLLCSKSLIHLIAENERLAQDAAELV